jgi:hypothetical protein
MFQVRNRAILRIVPVFIAVCLISLPAQAKYSGGSGTLQDPYQIHGVADWQTLMNTTGDWTKYFVLTDDLDLQGVSLTPVGTSSKPFAGVFDGDDRTISNTTMQQPSKNHIGLFGYVGQAIGYSGAGQIRNLGVINVTVAGNMYVGGIVGWNGGEITHCYVTGTVSGEWYVGGLTGYSQNAQLAQCYSTAKVNGTGHCVGGLVGHSSDGTLTVCHSTGAVTGYLYVGGLVGENSFGSSVTHCYSTGAVGGSGDVGGLVGANNGDLTASYATGQITGTSSSVGGLVGHNSGQTTYCYSTGAVVSTGQWADCIGGLAGRNWGTVTRCYSTGTVSGRSGLGGLVGDGHEGVWLCVWDVETSGQSGSVGGVGLTTQEMKDPQMLGLNGFADDPNWVLNAGMDYPRLAWEGRSGQTVQWPTVDWLRGEGTAEAPYQLSTAAQLIRLGRSGILLDKHFVLNANINLNPNLTNGQVFIQAPVPAFKGVFDGSNHFISNLTIEGTSLLGLFGYVSSGAQVKNLGVVDVDITGSDNYIGGLTGLNAGRILDCYSTGVVSGGSNIGGLIGENVGDVTGCYSDGEVKGSSDTGGLVGNNGSYDAQDTAHVTRCYSTSALRNSGGGLVGYNAGTVSGCYSAGAVRASSLTGGAGGLVAEGAGTVVHSVWDVETSGLSGSVGGVGLTTGEMRDPHTLGLNGFANDLNWVLNPGMDYPRLAWEGKPGQVIVEPIIEEFEGSGLEQNPYEIGAARQLILLGKSSILWDKHFILSADIDLDPNRPDGRIFGQAVIPDFRGVFDGKDHRISSLTIRGDSFLGLFGRLEPGAEIRNVTVADVDVTGHINSAGALVGYSDGGCVAGCHSTGTVDGGSDVGGLIGYNHWGGTVICCSSTVTASGSTAGGLVGCNYYATVVQCYSGGLVNSSLLAGGGLVGENYQSYVIDCYSTGAVSSTPVLGVIPCVGGLVGDNSRGYVIGSYCAGAVSGKSNIGGLVGYGSYGFVALSFWDYQTSGQLTSVGGTAMPTVRMQIAKTFLDAGWDFVGETANGTDDTWWIDEGKDYPRLWWEDRN